MKKIYLSLLLLGAAGILLAGYIFGRGFLSPPENTAKVEALLQVNPARISLASPLWDYSTLTDIPWVKREKDDHWMEFTWVGELDVDPEFPNLRLVNRDGSILPLLTETQGLQKLEPGYRVVSEGKRTQILKEIELTNQREFSLPVAVDSASPVVSFDLTSNLGYDQRPRLWVGLDSIWSVTLPAHIQDTRSLSFIAGGVEPGTHDLRFRVIATPSLRDPKISISNLALHSRLSVKAVLPSASEPPRLLYRPRDPVEDLLSRGESLPLPERVPSPWEVYDEDERWVRTIEINGTARTGVFLPTPSEWCVDVTPEAGSSLFFCPAIYNSAAPEKSGAAGLEVLVEQGERSESLWKETIGIPSKVRDQQFINFIRPHSWQTYKSETTVYQESWDKGVRIDLPPEWGEDPYRLVFRSTPLSATRPTEPVIVGSPVILPPPAFEKNSFWFTSEDVVDWERFCLTFAESGASSLRTPARRAWLLLDWRPRVAMAQLHSGSEVAEASKVLIVSGLNDLLQRPDLYEESSFRNVDLPERARKLLQKTPEGLSSDELLEFNRHLLEVAFPGLVKRHWGFVPPSPKTPNVILISLDTLRGDSLSCLGYNRPTTPWMDGYFGQQGVRFLNAQAPSSWTLPSHAGLFLSQFFSRHGIQKANHALGRHLEVLGEIFSEQGYETAAFVDRGYLHHRYGFDQGFQLYDERGGGFASILPRCQQWLENRDASTPLFLFLHTYDIHGPYSAPPPFLGAFSGEMTPSGPEVAFPDFSLFEAINTLRRTLSESDRDYCRARYDEGILATDQKLRAFFDWLEATGTLEDPLVVLLSDHGEAFGEHGYYDHGWSVYQEVVHVPLLFHFPQNRYSKIEIETPVSLIDAIPTVFDYLEWEKPSEWQGQSLIPRMLNPNLPEDRRLYAELETTKAMYHGFMKLMTRSLEMKRPDEKMAEDLEAYNLGDDPLETDNLVHSSIFDFTGEAELMNKALDIMESENRRAGGVEEAPPDEESVAELKAMGYLQ